MERLLQSIGPNGGDMHVSGAEIDGTEASGYNSRRERVEIEVDDYDEQGGEQEE
ncbi:MAG: hypothetical protein HY737_00265 [Candidatus Omnitrophica bacterium]|nr:hypothetical protein [Candidatus Omnitrophota bacterium]